MGVDVGGRRKGFDVALVDAESLVLLEARLPAERVVEIAVQHRVALAGVDAPRSCAPDGERSRAAERELAAAVCHIRYTPAEAEVRSNPFHEWVARGLDLHRSLAAAGVENVEVFPTASFTRWVGRRGRESRAAWSARGVAKLGLSGLPERLSQDARDAIAAAVTARQAFGGGCELFGGELAVPRGRR